MLRRENRQGKIQNVLQELSEKPGIKKRLSCFLAAFLLAKLIVISSIGFMEPKGASAHWTDMPDIPRLVLALGCQWDSLHYTRIAERGYPKTETHTMLYSFPPLFPVLIRLLTPLAGNLYLAGIIISNLFSFAAAYIFYRFACMLAAPSRALQAALLFALFPTNLAYGTVAYSEAPYLFFAIASLLCQYNRRYGPAAVFLTLALLTRSVGLVLIPVQFFLALYCERRHAESLHAAAKRLVWFFMPALAVLMLFLYYRSQTGNFLAVFHSGEYFGDSLMTPYHQYKDMTSGYFAFLNPTLDLTAAALERYVFTVPFFILSLFLFRIDWKLALYGCVFMYIALSMTGSAAAASARIMLASWVTCIVFTARMPGWAVWSLGILFTAAGVWVMYRFQTAMFI